MKNTWFEVFIDEGDELGTHTIETIDTEEEAVQFAEAYQQANPNLSIHVDKWELDRNGTPMPVAELF